MTAATNSGSLRGCRGGEAASRRQSWLESQPGTGFRFRREAICPAWSALQGHSERTVSVHARKYKIRGMAPNLFTVRGRGRQARPTPRTTSGFWAPTFERRQRTTRTRRPSWTRPRPTATRCNRIPAQMAMRSCRSTRRAPTTTTITGAATARAAMRPTVARAAPRSASGRFP